MEYIWSAAGMEDFEQGRAAAASAGTERDGGIEPEAQTASRSAQTPDTGGEGASVISNHGGKIMAGGRHDYRRND